MPINAQANNVTMRIFARLVLLSAAAALLLAACSSDDTPTPVPPTPTVAATAPSLSPVAIDQPTSSLPSVADVVAGVEPAVVSILVQSTSVDFFGRSRRSGGSGSGVIFREDGYILTNNHVVQDADRITVVFSDGREREGEIVGTDLRTDLAVVRVDERGLPTVPLADPTKLRVGDWVIAIGNALGLRGSPTVTLGIVSALQRSIPSGSGNVTLFDLIQTDAAINPGNSGGPLVNLQGEVVGINTAVLRGTDSGTEAQGIGFAVSMETAIPVANELVDNGRVVWPWLGVSVADVNPAVASEMGLTARSGVVINSIEAGAPAQQAGLEQDDVIVALGGQPVTNLRDLQRILRIDYEPGDEITATAVRDGREREFQVTLGESPR
ncbi:MAG: trypsin-like peptidase domain-containing protein [Chloroflexi bacterium]|nr:trypsin-like peptidase domain-containing protein [Chloroflexota bacterium]